MFTNNVLVQGNERTGCSNSFVEAQKTLWLKKSVVIKGEKCSRGDSEPRAKQTVLSALQDSLLSFVVFVLAPVTGVSSLPIKPIYCIPATTICTVHHSINKLGISFILTLIWSLPSLRYALLSVPGELQHSKPMHAWLLVMFRSSSKTSELNELAGDKMYINMWGIR